MKYLSAFLLVLLQIVVFSACTQEESGSAADVPDLADIMRREMPDHEKITLIKETLVQHPDLPKAAMAIGSMSFLYERAPELIEADIPAYLELLKKTKDAEIGRSLYALLAFMYGKTGDKTQMDDMARRLLKEKSLNSFEYERLFKSAVECENWELILQYAGTAIDTIKADPEMQKDTRMAKIIYRNAVSSILTFRSRAHVETGNAEAGLGNLREAMEIKPPNFLGVSSNYYFYVEGLAYRQLGQLDKAADSFAVEALFNGHAEAREALKELYVSNGGSEEGFAEYCEAKRSQLAQPAPDFTLKDYQGNPLTFSDLKGKVILVNFWSTTCVPCVAELPRLKPIWEKYHREGLEIVALSGYHREKAIEFIAEKELPFHFLEDPLGEQSIDEEVYKSYSHPVSCIIGRDGKAYYYHIGYSDGDEAKYEQEIISLLREVNN